MRTAIVKLFFCILVISAIAAHAQVSFNDAPIDCVRIEHSIYHNYSGHQIQHSIRFDSIDVNGLYRNGAWYSVDSLFTSKPYRSSTQYDNQRRKIHYSEWREENGIQKIFTDESFTYNSKGFLFTHKLVTPVDYTKLQADSFIYNSIDSISEKYNEIVYVSPQYSSSSKERKTFDYYPDHRLYKYEQSFMDSNGWKSYTSSRYIYSNSLNIPDTVYNDTIRFLHYKDELGRDTLRISRGAGNYLHRPMERLKYTDSSITRFVYYGLDKYDNDYTQGWTFTENHKLECYSYSDYGGGGSDRCYYYYPNGRIKSYYTSSYSTHDSGPYEDHEYSYKQIAIVPELSFSFTIFPNPAITSIDLLCNIEEEGDYSYLIGNNLGQTIRTGQIKFLKGATKLSISTEGISKGFYFLTLTKGETAITKKVVIAR